MIGLLIAILLFNFLMNKLNMRLNSHQIMHIWMFTVALQLFFDLFIDVKYHGYWYFTKDINWTASAAILLLVPPVNIIFLNYYPFKRSWRQRIVYILVWDVVLIGYELITLLPEPYGYFHYGWWCIWYSILLNPFLLGTLVWYYRHFVQEKPLP